MTDKLKPSTQKKKKSVIPKRKAVTVDATVPRFSFSLKKDWQTISLAFLTIACVYILFTAAPSLASQITSSFPTLLMNFAFSALVLAVFSILYIYKALRREVIRKPARIVASLFSGLLIASVVYVAFGIGQMCSSFFGVQDECTSVYAVTVYILLFNPYSLLLWNTLAFIGVVTLFTKAKASK